jgi:PAS domain S-box-containing protein
MNHDVYAGLARALFEESDDALFLIDPETGQILDANAAAQRMCGLSLRSILDSPLHDLFRGEGGERLIAFPMSGRKLSVPYADRGGLLIGHDDVNVPVDVTVTRLAVQPRALALFQPRAAFGYMSVSVMRPERLNRLLASAPGCLWSAALTQGHSQFIYLSPSIREVAGRSAGEFGKQLHRWREVIHPHDQTLWDDAMGRRRLGHATQVEYRVVWPDGSAHWIRDDARAVGAIAGRPVWLYGVFTDVTSQRQAELPVRRLAELVDTAEDAIIAQTMDGLIVDWNRGAERLYGYTKDEVRTQPVLRLFAPDGVKEYTDAMHRLRRGEHTEPYEAPQIRKDGQRFVASLRVSPIGGRAGELDGISIIARSARKPNGQPHRANGSAGGHEAS